MKSHRTLDQLDNVTDQPWQRPRPLTQAQCREEAMRLKSALGSGNCWCGEVFGHDWPGRDAGAPHPRETEGQ